MAKPVEPAVVRAFRGESTDVTPVWFMRQAGSHLPEHRDLFERHGIRTLTTTPELNAKVSLLPVTELGVDAAVMYADIILPLEDMGIEFHYGEGETGPIIHNPPRGKADVEDLRVLEPERGVPSILEAIRLVRDDLPDDKALIGFSGGPFTLAGYMIEGTASRSFPRTKTLMWEQPAVFERLLEILTESIIRYWNAQADAGADALQLFESWMGVLTPHDYRQHVLSHTQRLFDEFTDPDVPTVMFGTGVGSLLPELAATGADVLSPGWRTPLSRLAETVGTDRPVQGNLDPSLLLIDPVQAREHVDRILDDASPFPGHVFNTGHRIPLDTDPDRLRKLVKYVHNR